jgi:predicted nucleic acid-binding protein
MTRRVPTVLVDTSVLINFMHGRPQARGLLRDLGLRGVTLAISCISVAELYGEIRPGEEEATQRLLNSLDIFPVTFAIAQEAGLICSSQRRLGRTFFLDDMMIAATAILHDCVFVTDNRKDFEIPRIVLLPEY